MLSIMNKCHVGVVVVLKIMAINNPRWLEREKLSNNKSTYEYY